MRIGFGTDFHRLLKGRKLFLGGIEIPSEFGAVAHSDGDVVLHSLTDAILGSIGKGDIGDHFRDTEERWKDERSEVFLKKALSLLEEEGKYIENVDITLILEKPKLYDYKEKIKENIAKLLTIEKERVSFKCKTNEGLGDIGNSNALQCFAIVLVSTKSNL